MKEGVYARIVTTSHVWPGITPFNVWDLPWSLWESYARSTDDWIEEQKRGRH